MKKFKIKNFINQNGEKQEVEFEIQEMDLLMYQDIENSYTMGQIPLSKLAEAVLRDTIVQPIEARKVDYFSKHPKALDQVLGIIRGFLGAGLTQKIEIEILE